MPSDQNSTAQIALHAKLIASEHSGPSALTPEAVRQSMKSARASFRFGLASGLVVGDIPDFLAPMPAEELADWK